MVARVASASPIKSWELPSISPLKNPIKDSKGIAIALFVHPKLEGLHFFKEKVDGNLGDKLRIVAVLDLLSSADDLELIVGADALQRHHNLCKPMRNQGKTKERKQSE